MTEQLNDLIDEPVKNLYTQAIEAPDESDFTNLLIVDVLNTAFRYKARGQYIFAEDMVAMIKSLAKSYECKDIVVCGDWGSSSYRKELYPDYKANRKEKYANQSEAEKLASEQFFAGLDECYRRLDEEFVLLRLKNVESDDLMAYTIKKFENSVNYDKIWVISTDRDMCQMLSFCTSQFAYTSRKEYTMNNFYDLLGFDTPDEYAIFKAVAGDKSDNIPTAAEDCGPKRTYSIIRGMTHIMDLIEKLPMSGKQKYIQRLNAGEAQVLLNWELTNLREFCEVAINHPNPDNLKAVDEKLKCLMG
jgi:5'-3' exonuclease